MSKTKIKLIRPQGFLYFGLLLMLVKVILSVSEVLPYSEGVDRILSVLAASILLIEILKKRYSVKRLVIYILIIFLALYGVLITGQYGLLITIITCMAISDADINKVIQFIFQYELLLFILNITWSIFMSLLGSYSLSAVMYGVERYKFGFVHPNTLSVILFNLIIMWIWIKFEQIKWKHLGFIFFISLVSYYFTKTRTSFFCVLLVIIMVAFLMIKKRKFIKIYKYMTALIIPVLSIAFYFMIKLRTSNITIIMLVDRFLSARITLGGYAYIHYGLTMFGQNLQNMSVTWNEIWRLNSFTFDCTYTYLMVNQGIIWLIMLVVSFFMLTKYKSNKINVALISWGLYAMTEVHGLNGFMCFPVLLVSLLISKNVEVC